VGGGGPVTLTSYSVGASLPNSHGTRDDLISGTDLTFTNGQVARGNAVYGGAGRFTNVGFPNGSPRQGNVIDFPAARQFLEAASARWAALATNGTITWQSNQYTLVGSNAGLNVFNLSGANLAQATRLTITAPAGSTVLVNVDGGSLALANFAIRIRNTSQQKVLYNFAAATSLTVNNLTVPGSVLAPHAAATFTNGQIDGQLIAASFTGTTALNQQPFTGCLP
jgi:choice-of-anchor A domain-containing protein